MSYLSEKSQETFVSDPSGPWIILLNCTVSTSCCRVLFQVLIHHRGSVIFYLAIFISLTLFVRSVSLVKVFFEQLSAALKLPNKVTPNLSILAGPIHGGQKWLYVPFLVQSRIQSNYIRIGNFYTSWYILSIQFQRVGELSCHLPVENKCRWTYMYSGHCTQLHSYNTYLWNMAMQQPISVS